jgi:hypothetical protein
MKKKSFSYFFWISASVLSAATGLNILLTYIEISRFILRKEVGISFYFPVFLDKNNLESSMSLSPAHENVLSLEMNEKSTVVFTQSGEVVMGALGNFYSKKTADSLNFLNRLNEEKKLSLQEFEPGSENKILLVSPEVSSTVGDIVNEMVFALKIASQKEKNTTFHNVLLARNLKNNLPKNTQK